MQQFVFTPGQREEALTWLQKENLPFYKFIMSLPEPASGVEMLSIQDCIIDMFYKLRGVSFPLKPEEFIVGIEYTDQIAVTEGEQQINIRVLSPRRETPHDPFAFQVIMELLNRLKE